MKKKLMMISLALAMLFGIGFVNQAQATRQSVSTCFSMPLPLTVTGYQPLTMVTHGLQRMLVQIGILTPAGTGSGRIMDGPIPEANRPERSIQM